MVRIVNGQVVDSSSAASAVQKRRSKGPLDQVAGFFWSIVSFFVLFFHTMFKPGAGGGKRTEGKSRIKTINPGPCDRCSPKSGPFNFGRIRSVGIEALAAAPTEACLY
ncbi:unnamed protein product [Symbiodinium natans]|uniref:Selenoprotein K n=1 Tax=Symbiodinium natans TaxID=878477 RepID=A0A812Q5Q5_9DINO|nr:unnamed protein product [Symbiodinium natans]